jgi:hypothetical protein
MPQNLSSQQHLQNFRVTLQLRMETMEGVQSGHDAKTKPAVSVQQVLYEGITCQLRANIRKDHENLLAHLDGYSRVAQMVARAPTILSPNELRARTVPRQYPARRRSSKSEGWRF